MRQSDHNIVLLFDTHHLLLLFLIDSNIDGDSSYGFRCLNHHNFLMLLLVEIIASTEVIFLSLDSSLHHLLSQFKKLLFSFMLLVWLLLLLGALRLLVSIVDQFGSHFCLEHRSKGGLGIRAV